MSSHTPPNADDNISWDDCPAGKISHLNQQLKTRDQQALVKRRALFTCLLLIALAPVALWVNNSNNILSKDLGGISCNDVISHYKDFTGKKLDVKLTSQISTHLSNCPMCRDHYDHYNRSLKKQAKSNAQVFFLNENSFVGRLSERQNFKAVAYIKQAF